MCFLWIKSLIDFFRNPKRFPCCKWCCCWTGIGPAIASHIWSPKRMPISTERCNRWHQWWPEWTPIWYRTDRWRSSRRRYHRPLWRRRRPNRLGILVPRLTYIRLYTDNSYFNYREIIEKSDFLNDITGYLGTKYRISLTALWAQGNKVKNFLKNSQQGID